MINYSCDCCKRDITDDESFWAAVLSVVENNCQDKPSYIFHFCGECCRNFVDQFDLRPLKYGDNTEEEE